jgi:hypothetical protein
MHNEYMCFHHRCEDIPTDPERAGRHRRPSPNNQVTGNQQPPTCSSAAIHYQYP